MLFTSVLQCSQRGGAGTENHGVGIVWVAQAVGHGSRGTGEDDEMDQEVEGAGDVRLVVAGFTPHSCARDKGVALGDVLVAFRSGGEDKLVHVSRLLSGGCGGCTDLQGGDGQVGEILRVHKAMVGAQGSICELHLLRSHDEPRTSSARSPYFSPPSPVESSLREVVNARDVSLEVQGWGWEDTGPQGMGRSSDGFEQETRHYYEERGDDALVSGIRRVKNALSRLRDAVELEDVSRSMSQSGLVNGTGGAQVGVVDRRGRQRHEAGEVSSRVNIHGRGFGGQASAGSAQQSMVAFSPSSRQSRARLLTTPSSSLSDGRWGWRGPSLMFSAGPGASTAASNEMEKVSRAKTEYAIAGESSKEVRGDLAGMRCADRRHGQRRGPSDERAHISPANARTAPRSPSHESPELLPVPLPSTSFSPCLREDTRDQVSSIVVIHVPRMCEGRGLDGLLLLM